MSSYTFYRFLSSIFLASAQKFTETNERVRRGKNSNSFLSGKFLLSDLLTSHNVVRTVPSLNTILGFEVVPKIAFGWQFDAFKNLGSTLIVTVVANDASGRNFGSNGFRQVFDSILGAILSSWVPTSTQVLSSIER